MTKTKEKRKPDERIEKESNALTAKMFWVITPLLLVSLAVKLVCTLPWYLYVLEILCLAVSGVYVLVQELRNGILFAGKKDAALTEIHNGILAKAFMVDFYGMVFGEFVLMAVLVFVVKNYVFWVFSYLLIWIVPAVVITVVSVKKGLMVWGGKKQEKEGKKNFAGRVVIGALLYGILMEAFDRFEHVYHDGAFHIEGVLRILGMAVLWGVLFYFAMLLVIKISEKHADAQLEAVNGESVEQEGE